MAVSAIEARFSAHVELVLETFNTKRREMCEKVHDLSNKILISLDTQHRILYENILPITDRMQLSIQHISQADDINTIETYEGLMYAVTSICAHNWGN